MRIGVLGTGRVGRTLGSGFAAAGHHVVIGSRTSDSPSAVDWAAETGGEAGYGTFAAAARHAEVLVNCTPGAVSLEAIGACAAADLDGKVLVDVANPLDSAEGFPPTLTVCNDDSLAEQIQRAHPSLQVVKTLNTVNASVMTNPAQLSGDHTLFLSGDHEPAKATVLGLLADLGWRREQVLDLGGVETARGPEMYLALWIRMMPTLGTPTFNIAIARP